MSTSRTSTLDWVAFQPTPVVVWPPLKADRD